MQNLRVFYEKTGRAKYISHLDVTRCMQRAIKRAGLPVWYTEGFNPHIYLTFALPLSLGYESVSESMDFRLVEEMPFGVVEDRLNAVLPPDIRVLKVDLPMHKAEEIAAAEYAVHIVPRKNTPDALAEQFRAFLQRPEILVEKQTKRGAKMVDIRPDCTMLALRPEADELYLALKMTAGLERNINPSLLLDAFLQSVDETDATVRVLRRAVLLPDGTLFV